MRFEADAAAHWAYVRKVICLHEGIDPECPEESLPTMAGNRYLEIIGFHYQAAMIHGFKHGVEITRKTPQLPGPCDFSFSCSEHHDSCQATADALRAEVKRLQGEVDSAAKHALDHGVRKAQLDLARARRDDYRMALERIDDDEDCTNLKECKAVAREALGR